MSVPTINRTNPYFFKYMFGFPEHKDLLLEFINSIISDDPDKNIINDFEYINTRLDYDDISEQKLPLDFSIITNTDIQIEIEIHATKKNYLFKRDLYFWSLNYIQSIICESSYNSAIPIYIINILTYNITENNNYINKYIIANKDTNEILNNYFSLYYIELPKWETLALKPRNRLERWISYLSSHDPEHIKKLSIIDNNIKTALDYEKKFIADEKARRRYFQYEDAIRDYYFDIESSKDEGIMEGKREGILEGKREGIVEGKREGISIGSHNAKVEIAKNLINMNLNTDLIQKATGMTAEEIDSLRKE